MESGILVLGMNMDGSEEKRRVRLVRLMQRLKISNVELANRCGMTDVTISRLRSGASKLNDVESIEKIAEALGVHVCYFFLDDDENLDLMGKAMAILRLGGEPAHTIAEVIERLQLETQKGPEQDGNSDIRKDIAEMKSILQQMLGSPPLPFAKAAAPKKIHTHPRHPKKST